MVKIKTEEGNYVEIDVNKEVSDLKAGDLIIESVHPEPRKAIVVGVNESKNTEEPDKKFEPGKIWTVDVAHVKSFCAGHWKEYSAKNRLELVRRPDKPDTTIEGLQRSLEEFVAESL